MKGMSFNPISVMEWQDFQLHHSTSYTNILSCYINWWSESFVVYWVLNIRTLVVPKSPWGSVFERLSQYASPRFILLIINSTYHKSHKVITSLCIVCNRSMFGTLASMNGELTLYYSHYQLNASTSLTVYNYAVIPWRSIWSKF